MTPLEITGGNSFSLEGFVGCFLQFKTLCRVIYITLEGFRYLSKGFIALQIKGFHIGNRVDCITSAQRYSGPTQTSFFSSFKLLLVRCNESRIHTSLKKVCVSDLLYMYIRPIVHVHPTYCTCRLHSFLMLWLHSSVGRMHNVSRSDAQLY